MSEERIVVTRPLAGNVTAMLQEHGYENVSVYPDDRAMPRAQLLEMISGAHAIIATPADVGVNAELFDAAGAQLVVVSNYAVGVDNVDLDEARRRGITVTNTPGAVTEPTADIAWLLLLGAARRVTEAARLVRSGTWPGIGPNQLLGQRVIGKTLLIVGAGRIGAATARRAIGWNMPILYCARSPHEEFEAPPLSARRVSLEEGLATADFVSLHTPLTPETWHLMNTERLGLMKPNAILVNTARGAVVDEAALVEALESRGIAAAGLDVYEHEPKLHPGLTGLDNVFLLPHLGTATVDDREWMTKIAVDNAVAALRGETPAHVV